MLKQVHIRCYVCLSHESNGTPYLYNCILIRYELSPVQQTPSVLIPISHFVLVLHATITHNVTSLLGSHMYHTVTTAAVVKII